MTLDEARDHIGEGVVYTPAEGDPEDGVIVGASSTTVFVRYKGDLAAKGTNPADLTLLSRAAAPAATPELTEMNRLDAWNWLMRRLNRPQFHAAIEAARKAKGETVTTPWGFALRVYQKDDSFWRFGIGETTAGHVCEKSTACTALLGCAFGGVQ